jgi:spore coat polysaccharide biosynthesis protein SpsF
MNQSNTLKIIGVIQARMGSQRLPGKVLLPMGGKTAIQLIAERLRSVALLDDVVLATADTPENDELAAHGEDCGLLVVRGDEADLIARMQRVVSVTGADALLVVTADCPLADPKIVTDLLSAYVAEPTAYEYYTNAYPLTFPDGLDLNLIPTQTLAALDRDVSDPFYREWFISYLREHPELFRILNLTSGIDFPSDLRLTVDYEEDLHLISTLLEQLKDQGSLVSFHQVYQYTEKHPEVKQLNANRIDLVMERGIKGGAYHELVKQHHGTQN